MTTPERFRTICHGPYNPRDLPQSFQAGDVISYKEMCAAIGVNLQRGMNFRLRESESIILMSLRPGAPYADRVEDDGRTLIYEGHDVSRSLDGPGPKRDGSEAADRHRAMSSTT